MSKLILLAALSLFGTWRSVDHPHETLEFRALSHRAGVVVFRSDRTVYETSGFRLDGPQLLALDKGGWQYGFVVFGRSLVLVLDGERKEFERVK